MKSEISIGDHGSASQDQCRAEREDTEKHFDEREITDKEVDDFVQTMTRLLNFS
jgi:hypothetical protein